MISEFPIWMKGRAIPKNAQDSQAPMDVTATYSRVKIQELGDIKSKLPTGAPFNRASLFSAGLAYQTLIL